MHILHPANRGYCSASPSKAYKGCCSFSWWRRRYLNMKILYAPIFLHQFKHISMSLISLILANYLFQRKWCWHVFARTSNKLTDHTLIVPFAITGFLQEFGASGNTSYKFTVSLCSTQKYLEGQQLREIHVIIDDTFECFLLLECRCWHNSYSALNINFLVLGFDINKFKYWITALSSLSISISQNKKYHL